MLRRPGTILRFVALSLAVATVFYATAVGYLYVNQQRMQYFPATGEQRIDPSGPPIQRVTIRTADGETLVGWYLPPEEDYPVFLYFNGNGLGLADYDGRWREIANGGAGFLAIGWRGFSGSTGEPSEAGLRQDAAAAYGWLVQRHPPEAIVIHGYSLGTGLAVWLAAERPAKALILEAPFTSALDLARERVPWAPVGLLLRDRYLSRDRIGQVRMPVLIAHGDRDALIPIAHGRALFALANQPKQFVEMRGSDHASMTADGLYGRIWDFLIGLPDERPRDLRWR